MQRTPIPICETNLIAAMSSIVALYNKQEIKNSWNTIKVDGTKHATDVENIFVVIRFFKEHCLRVAEGFLVLSSTDLGDANSIIDVILAELTRTKAGLTSSKILSRACDGASVMAGH